LRFEKLKHTSIAELRVRGAQAFAMWRERNQGANLKPQTDADLFKLFSGEQNQSGASWSADSFRRHFQTRTLPRFFPPFSAKLATLGEFQTRWPQAESDIISRAERIIDGRFDLLGLTDVCFGNPIDWHLEPRSGVRSPLIHWSRLDFLDPNVAGDKKVTWELNRHQHFNLLGEAYWLSGDEKFARTLVSQLEQWMEKNPPKLGINWASSLEIAFRSIAWLWALHFLKDSQSLSGETMLRVLRFLYFNARHLETYLSTYFSPNTHLTGEALGLFYLGLLLPEFKEAGRWKDTGRQVLLEQLDRHVQSDGVYFEQASYYHRYTTDFYLHFMILAQLNGEAIPAEVATKLQALLTHLALIMRPDGTTPFFGDDDGGRLLNLEPRAANDFRAALSTGAVLLERPELKFGAGELSRETLWLLGPQGARKFDRLESQRPALDSAAFDVGGYYVMRDGWSQTANYLLVDCGPHGWANCGHAHADALSFELAAGGRCWLVDPGTFTYTGSQNERDWFRNSLAHNTLTVDRESSSQPAGPFSWNSIARPELLSWVSKPEFDFFKGRHDGYSRLADPVSHTRSILFPKKEYWVMRDVANSAGNHQYDLWFHFDSKTNPQVQTSAGKFPAVVAANDEFALAVVTLSPDGGWKTEAGWVSHCYGEKVAAPVYTFSVAGRGDLELVTFLLPYHCAAPPPRVRELEARGGRAFEIDLGDTLDVVLINHDGCVESGNLASDCEWSWARFSGSNRNELEEVILINGGNFSFAGKSLQQSHERFESAVIRCSAGRPAPV
jgi:hypothetical protein